ncbi:MAG: zinc-ribbon domain containing protein [Chloroflexi bacterium]|nr:zinc-ribbon domain containing protein [Chloroflexota bacterium]
MAFEDKTLKCRDCGMDFVFSAGEQEFYAAKGFRNEPQRCPSCRTEKRRQRASGSRESFTVTCAQCGAETTVPFVPRLSRPVYCSDCFAKMRSASTSP